MAQRQSSEGIDCVIKHQGVALAIPKEKCIQALFDGVKKFVCVVLLPVVYRRLRG